MNKNNGNKTNTQSGSSKPSKPQTVNKPVRGIFELNDRNQGGKRR